MRRFAFVHHRALNSAVELAIAAQAARRRPELAHVVEGDLCWHEAGGRCEFYFHHPIRLTDTLPLEVIQRGAADRTLHTLEDVLRAPDPELRYVFELKVGVGDPERAVAALIERLEAAIPDRYWIDAFSLRLLATVKRINPRVATSLHTRFMLGRWVLRSAPELLPLSIHATDGLPNVDAVTLTYKYIAHRMLRATELSTPPRLLRTPDRPLVIGGLPSPEAFELARRSGAVGGYAKFPLDHLP